jgi:hypothetical protein
MFIQVEQFIINMDSQLTHNNDYIYCNLIDMIEKCLISRRNMRQSILCIKPMTGVPLSITGIYF